MQQDNFYKSIQEKLDLLESNSDWNKDAVWNRINRQEGVKVIKKPNRWFYFGMAASVAIFSLIGLWIFKQKVTQSTDIQSVKIQEKAIIPITKSNSTEKIQISKVENIKQEKIKTVSTNEQVELVNLPEPKVENPIVKAPIQRNEAIEQNHIVQHQPVEKQTEVIPNQEVEEDHYDRKAVKPASNRVVVLNIPVAEEENDKGNQKKSLIGKVFKKDHPKQERSDKIWAFVKESFKNESIEEKKDTVR